MVLLKHFNYAQNIALSKFLDALPSHHFVCNGTQTATQNDENRVGCVPFPLII